MTDPNIPRKRKNKETDRLIKGIIIGGAIGSIFGAVLAPKRKKKQADKQNQKQTKKKSKGLISSFFRGMRALIRGKKKE